MHRFVSNCVARKCATVAGLLSLVVSSVALLLVLLGSAHGQAVAQPSEPPKPVPGIGTAAPAQPAQPPQAQPAPPPESLKPMTKEIGRAHV